MRGGIFPSLIVIFVFLTILLSTLPIEMARGQTSTVHFMCQTMNRGAQGSITFSGSTFTDGQSSSYAHSEYWVRANLPTPSSEWRFYRWTVYWLGSQSWVDNQWAQETWFHLRGEAYLKAEFYAPISTTNPLYPTLFYGEKQRITGAAIQYYGQQLSVLYYPPETTNWGPRNLDGSPPPEFGCDVAAGYLWATVNVGPYPGSFDSGLITPMIPRYSTSYTLPMTVNVFTSYGVGTVNEVDSNVVSFQIQKAPVLINAPDLSSSSISLGQSVTITGQIFSRYYIDANDLTGTWRIQVQRQGETTWTDIATQSCTSVHGYSAIYGEIGVYCDVSYTWTPSQAGDYDIRISYDGNRYYNSQTSLSSTLDVGGAVDLGIAPKLQHKDTHLLCLGNSTHGCSLEGDHSWDAPHLSRDCDHDDMYCVPASISMINSYYGGLLSQDRIMYYVMHDLNDVSVPEYQLGHARGVYSQETMGEEIKMALSWALNDATIEHVTGQPDFQQIRAWIDAGRPILRRQTAGGDHVTVIDGYEEVGSLVHVINPWTGSESSPPYLTLDVVEVWVPPVLATARFDEGTIHTDSDGDGVFDFDETNRFHTNPYNPDSDGDLVYDKQEIISYTFLANGQYDTGDTRGPDNEYWIVGDGLRAELDTDSDNGGTTDGLEDMNRNGRVDLGETDPLNPFDDWLRAAALRVTAYSPVNILVTDPENRHVGFDNETQSTVNEIPGASYSGPGSEPQEIAIPNSLNGTYKIEVFGTGEGDYTIILQSLDSNGTVIDSDTWEGTTALGEYASESVDLETDGEITLPHDVEAMGILYSKTHVAVTYIMLFNVTFFNKGNYTEVFNATAYANGTLVDSKQGLTVEPRGVVTVTFAWNTSGFAYGEYILKGIAEGIMGEVDTLDNEIIGDAIKVTLIGDVDGNDTVDIFDLVRVATLYGEMLESTWPLAPEDINDDLVVNIFDLVLVALRYGETCP